MTEIIPRNTLEFGAWVPFVQNLVDRLQRKHSNRLPWDSNWDEDLAQDVITALLVGRVIEKFWEKAADEEDRLYTIAEAATFLGLASPDTFRVRMWRNRRLHPNRRLKVCDKSGNRYATKCPKNRRRAYFRQSDLVRWQVDFYPTDRVTFVEGAGIPLVADVSQWRGYLARAIINRVKNVYRWRSRHHLDRPAQCFSEFCTADGEYVFEENLASNDTPENILMATENPRIAEALTPPNLIRLRETTAAEQVEQQVVIAYG